MFFLQNRRPPFQPLRVPRLQRNDGPLGAIYSRSASSRSISPGLEDTSSLSSSNVSVLIVISFGDHPEAATARLHNGSCISLIRTGGDDRDQTYSLSVTASEPCSGGFNLRSTKSPCHIKTCFQTLVTSHLELHT